MAYLRRVTRRARAGLALGAVLGLCLVSIVAVNFTHSSPSIRYGLPVSQRHKDGQFYREQRIRLQRCLGP